MNNENETRDKSLYWWGNLTQSKRVELRDKYFPDRPALTADERLHIYLSEHPLTEPVKPVVDVLDLLKDMTNKYTNAREENKLLRESNERMKEALKKNHQWALCLLSDIEAGNVEYEEKYCLELNQDISEATELLK